MNHKARDIMTSNIIVVDEDTTINNLIGIFMDKKISCVPVVNEENKLVGIVTKTDVLGHFMDIDLHISIKDTLKDILEFSSEQRDFKTVPEKEIKVKDIMTPNPITTGEDATVESLAKTMINNNIHQLIITREDKIAGIVSTLDILYHVAGIDKHERRQ